MSSLRCFQFFVLIHPSSLRCITGQKIVEHRSKSRDDHFQEVNQMRLFISLSAAIIFAVVALTACNSTDGSATKSQTKPQTVKESPSPVAIATPSDGVRRVTVAELREALDKGAAVVVDVRSADQYKASHIKSAVHIPETEVAARSGELPRDKMIVTYCS
jgi:3-mercaptopyruvate sulfurtransferase SseA